MRKIILSLTLFAAAFVMNSFDTAAQIVITPSLTAVQLASKLVGGGVVVTSPVLTCPTVANGTFAGPSSLSFDSGVVLTTGRAQTMGFNYGAGGPASNFASTSNAVGGDPLLTALAGQPTFDRCILEFDFRPSGDTIKFDYVFGSEEYDGFTCTNFNDVFGFFVTGPGYASPTNIALVPGTTIPVCINSVNCGPTGGGSLSTCTALGAGSPFCAYYVNNSAGTTITYDGLTTTLTAIARVTPCENYHLKIGIADGTDHIYDSGVFLKAGSLVSTGISVTPVGMNSTDTTAGGQYCVRGCLPGQFVFHISAPQATDYPIHYIIGGTAVNGVDYSTISDSVVIAAGSTSSTLYINPLTTAAGNSTVVLYILSPYSCGSAGPSIIDTVVMNIFDAFYVHIITPDTTICYGGTVNILSTGDPALTYNWTPSTTGSSPLSVMVTPSVTTTYSLSGVFPGVGCLPSTDEITITVVFPFSLNVGPDIQNTCVGVPLPANVTLVYTTPPPAGTTYSYIWSPAGTMTGATTASPVITPTSPGDSYYYVTVADDISHCAATDSFLLHVLPNDFTLVNPDSVICFSGVIPIRLVGDAEFTYSWSPAAAVSNANIATPIVSVAQTTTLTVTASYPGCPDMVHTVAYTVEAPHVDIRTHDTTFCIGDSIFVNVEATPPGAAYTLSWTPTTYLLNATTLTPTFLASVTGDFPYSVTITSPLGCTSTDMITLSPRPPALISITPGNTLVMYGDHVQLDATNLTPYPLFYYWTPNNGSLDNPNVNNPVATVYDSTTYVVYAMNEWGCRDSARTTLLVDNGTVEFVPGAFTPNGDGLNDLFRIMNMRYQKLVMFEVYNRWGQRVYQNNNTNESAAGWDGTFEGVPQDMGVYKYQIIVAKPDGKEKMYKGDVTLIR